MTTTTDLKEIARAGGGLSLDAKAFTTTDLKEIGRAASTSGAMVVLRNSSSKTTTDLKEIARTSPGKWVFEF